MLIADIKRAKDARPFRHFRINLADGREVFVTHPHAVAWNPKNPVTLIHMGHDESLEWIDVSLIVSVTIPGEPQKNS